MPRLLFPLLLLAFGCAYLPAESAEPATCEGEHDAELDAECYPASRELLGPFDGPT
ncbi:MAG: hypothetical protein AAF430_18055 [Myxococcota bacterium]